MTRQPHPIPRHATLGGPRQGGLGARFRQAGISMLETLVTLAVVSTGLLGIAGMQVDALRTNQSADHASLAVQQAYDMVERMRANPVGVAANSYDNLDASIPAMAVDCAAAACTAQQLATYDHNRWNTGNGNSLPNGSGLVTDTGGNTFWIAVRWHDKTLNAATGWQAGTDAATACGAPAANTRCYFVRHRG